MENRPQSHFIFDIFPSAYNIILTVGRLYMEMWCRARERNNNRIYADAIACLRWWRSPWWWPVFFFSFERNQIFIFFYFSQRVPVQLLPSDGHFGNQQPRKLGGTNRLYFCITDRLQCLPLPLTKKKKTRIDHFEINWKWHSIINWQNLEKRKRRKIWRLIEAGGHVSARLGSTQSEQTPMISSSQEWEKPDWEEEEDLTRR